MPFSESPSHTQSEKKSKKKGTDTEPVPGIGSALSTEVEVSVVADAQAPPAPVAVAAPAPVAVAPPAPKPAPVATVPAAPAPVRTEETFTISLPSGMLVIGDPDHINHKWKGASVATGRFAVDFDGPDSMLLSTGGRFAHPWEVLADGVVRVRPASLPEAGALYEQAKNIIAAQKHKTTVHMMNLDQTTLEAEDACRSTGAGKLAYLDIACVKLDRVPGRRSAGARQVTVISVDGVPTELRVHLNAKGL